MNFILFDDHSRVNLLPFTFTRPICDIRIGILTIREKWEKFLNAKTSTLTEIYLAGKYPLNKAKENILINGSVLPTQELINDILKLKPGQSLTYQDEYIIAMNLNEEDIETMGSEGDGEDDLITSAKHIKLNNIWDIFSLNGEAIEADFALITKGRTSQKLSATNRAVREDRIFIEEGAEVEFSILNATEGPIYIGKNAKVMEGSLIKGGFALGEEAWVKMGAKIYGPTTIGPNSKVGGELKNVVIFANSNKAHDGYLGNSVLGEWCNLGACTSVSNMKNTYDTVRLWNYGQESFIDTGELFCGLFMGDHSKSGINTMFNTGTVVGVYTNIFGAGFPRNFVPSFVWGGMTGFKTYELDQAFIVAERAMSRRNIELTDTDKGILSYIHELTKKNRRR